MKKLFTLVGRLFSLPRGKHMLMLKHAKCHRCAVAHWGNLLVTLAPFLRFLKGNFFKTLLTADFSREKF